VSDTSVMQEASLAEICAVACADAFAEDGEILLSPMGFVPSVGARLAKATFAPDVVLTDGEAMVVENITAIDASPDEKVVGGYLPFRNIFDVVWSGKRHVMMGATQLDQYGNQNISCVGPWDKPKVQLLGVRGAPGNTVNHATSYWVARHTTRVFVETVDMVSGVGNNKLSAHAGRYHHIKRVISNLGVFDFETPDKKMQICSLHPGVSLEQVQDQTGFELIAGASIPVSRMPSDEELRLIRDTIDPNGLSYKEVADVRG
jgi:acyl CoA:acetate/3-ketoacid CoA transferase beta subunit